MIELAMRSLAKRAVEAVVSKTFPGVMVEPQVTLFGCEFDAPVRVGYRSYANDSILRNVTVGRYCSIGRRCTIGAPRHDIDAMSSHSLVARPGFDGQPHTAIGNDVWIGDGALIMAGVTIGDGACIGGGAVVTRDVAPYQIVAGMPARFIRDRFDPAVTARLSASHWWDFAEGEVIEAADRFAQGPERDLGLRTTYQPGYRAFRRHGLR